MLSLYVYTTISMSKPVSLLPLVRRQELGHVDGLVTRDALVTEPDLGQQVRHLRELFVRLVGELKSKEDILLIYFVVECPFYKNYIRLSKRPLHT